MLRDMATPEHAFGASFDADAAGKEGASYLWSPSELRSALGEADGATMAAWLGVTDTGNFDGASIPTLRRRRHEPEHGRALAAVPRKAPRCTAKARSTGNSTRSS